MKTRTTSVLICLIIAAIALIGLYYFCISYVGGLGRQTAQLNLDLDSSQIKYVRLLSLRAIVKSSESNGQQLDSYLVQPGQEIDLVKEVEGLADQLALTHSTDQIDTQDLDVLASQNKELLHIVISTTGGWNSTRRFLSLIEALPFNIRLNKVDFNLSGDTSSPAGDQWRGRFDFSVVKKKASTGQ